MADKRRRRLHKQCRKKPSKRPKIKLSKEDFISSMPDEILHQILSFIPTSCAIRTSVLSRRWRHVWCETTSLYIEDLKATAQEINQTLTYFTAPKIMSFHLSLCRYNHFATKIDRWIEFAISHSVQKLSLNLNGRKKTYNFPECFYLCSSIKQLSVETGYMYMIPTCIVSWQSLRNLSLRGCRLRVKPFAKIISGCPNLESLAFKSLSLARLEIDHTSYSPQGPTEIVAPHILYLRLKSSEKTFTLADVSSLTEANLDIHINIVFSSKADFLQLAKLHNVKRLTVGATFLQILSHAELGGVHFEVLKVQTLIVKTNFVRSVIPGLARLLQNSPDLKEDVQLAIYLDAHWRWIYSDFPTSYEDMYSISRCKVSTWKLLLASFMELVLRNAKTLETMVLRLGGFYFKEKWFKKVLRIIPTLSHNTSVSIVLNRSNC
ncbi:hypothetical protein EUTSA_v10026908mg [Eutrema salsugineum]|uniref:F-box domain-containing protein n=1 Tax=Eutrema salsugineum TaxID=72664 RepID=V4P967_EUTSA|nr:hypothetical protein EUTSA_v10026908mg [Eutrema salsugineum]